MKKMNFKNLFSLAMLLLMFLMAGTVAFAEGESETGTQGPYDPCMTGSPIIPTPDKPDVPEGVYIDKEVDEKEGDKLPELPEDQDREFSFIIDKDGNKVDIGLKDDEKPLDGLKPGQITIKEDLDKAAVDGYTHVGVKYEVSWEKTNTVDKNGTLNLKIPGEEGKADDTGKLVSIKPDIPKELEGDLKEGVEYKYTVKDKDGNIVETITLTGGEVKNGKTLDISLKPGDYKVDMEVIGGPNGNEDFMVFVGDEEKAKDMLGAEEENLDLKGLVDKIDEMQKADDLSEAAAGFIDMVATGNGNTSVKYESTGAETPEPVTMTIVKRNGEDNQTYTYTIDITYEDGRTEPTITVIIDEIVDGYGSKTAELKLKSTKYTINIKEKGNAIADSSTVKSEGEFSKEFDRDDIADNELSFELENNMVAHIKVTNTYEKIPDEPNEPEDPQPQVPQVPQTPQTPQQPEPPVPEQPEPPETDTIVEPAVPLTSKEEPEESMEIPEEDVPRADVTPETGDASLTVLWAGLAAVSAAGMGAVLLLPRRKEEQDK